MWFFNKPFLKFERLIETYLAHTPNGYSPLVRQFLFGETKLFLKNYLISKFLKLDKNFNENKLKFCEHHLSHAASAFYPSPFEGCNFNMDGVGEWATTSIGIGKKNKIQIVKEINYLIPRIVIFRFHSIFRFKVKVGI